MTEQHPSLAFVQTSVGAGKRFRFPEGARGAWRRWSARVRGAWVSGRGRRGCVRFSIFSPETIQFYFLQDHQIERKIPYPQSILLG